MAESLAFIKGLYPEYIGLAVLQVVGILYLLSKKFKWFQGKEIKDLKVVGVGLKLKSGDDEPTRRSKRETKKPKVWSPDDDEDKVEPKTPSRATRRTAVRVKSPAKTPKKTPAKSKSKSPSRARSPTRKAATSAKKKTPAKSKSPSRAKSPAKTPARKSRPKSLSPPKTRSRTPYGKKK